VKTRKIKMLFRLPESPLDWSPVEFPCTVYDVDGFKVAVMNNGHPNGGKFFSCEARTGGGFCRPGESKIKALNNAKAMIKQRKEALALVCSKYPTINEL
jgi:hypothetical protein